MSDVLLFLHILGAAMWIGGGVAFVYTFTRITREGGESTGRAMEAIAARADAFFGVGAGVVLLSGIGLVLTSDAYGWGDTFVWVGIGAFVASGIWQAAAGGKIDERLLKSVAGDGTDPLAALRTWQRASLVDFAVLGVALWAMVVKLGAG